MTTKSLLALHAVPRPVLWTTATASYAAAVVGALSGWQAWAYALSAAAIWAPVLLMETAWLYRHYRWIALFYALVVTQGAHFLEHVAQMVQVHLLGRDGPDARGVVGALDVEWVHLGFNTCVFVALVALLVPFRANPWLWATLVVAAWHQVEHTYIISVFLSTATEGTPGLLAIGGRLGGGLSLTRPDLHFLYNVVETVPLFVAFGWQLKRAYSNWLARAFPRLEPAQLRTLTERARIRHRPAGAMLVREGDPADDLFVLARGEVEVRRRGPVGDQRVAILRAGQVFGESAATPEGYRTATVRTRTPVELVHLDRAAASGVLAQSAETVDDLRRLREHRAPDALMQSTQTAQEGANQ